MNKFLISLLSLTFLIGCTTMTNPTPDIVVPDEIAFDGNAKNSGILYQVTSGGFIITENAKNRYNSYIEAYGARFSPALTKDFGITPIYMITDEGMQNFLQMNLYEKNKDVIKNQIELEKKAKDGAKKWYQFWRK